MRKFYFHISILLFFIWNFCQTSSVVAREPNVRFHTLDLQDKLASNYVNCSLLDSKGFLWFGTQEGLSRYDGYEFKLFRNSAFDTSSIGGNYITALLEDNDRNIWIGTSQEGLSVLNQHTNTIRKYDIGKRLVDLPSNFIVCIFKDSKGIVWVGTAYGLCRFDPTKDGFVTYKNTESKISISSNLVMCICEDKMHNIWIGTSNGLNVFNRKTEQFERIFHDHGNLNSPASNYIRSILPDDVGNLWLATDDAGLSKLNLKTGKYIHYQHNEVNPNSLSINQTWCLFMDSKRNIWIGTINGGLNLYNPRNEGFVKFNYSKNNAASIPSNSVTSITEDISGNLWFTTHGGGIACLNTWNGAFEHYKAVANNVHSLSHNIIKCFFEDQTGQIWIGTDGGGLNLFDRKNGDFKAFRIENGLSSNVVLDICEADANHIWLATWGGGICLFNIRDYSVQTFMNDPNNKNSLSNNNISGIHKTADGKVWIITHGGGVNIYDPSARQFLNPLNSPELNLKNPLWGTLIITEESGANWVASYAGLFKFENSKITSYFHDAQNRKSLSGNYVYDILQDSKSRLWFATNNGLDLYNREDQSFDNVSDKLGFPGTVKSVIDDKYGNIWFTMGNQLMKLVKKDTCLIYNFQPGQYSEKASYRSANGDLYFGSTDGFIVVHPDKIAINSLPPPVYITDFQLFNVSQKAGKLGSVLKNDISETSEIILAHNQSAFSFEFVALNYISTELNKYEYKLEGFDKDWVVAGENRKATYTNISHGTYTFRVKAANNDGVWNEKGASVQIIVLPPFWLTIWAFIIYGIVSVLLLLAYRRFILFKERLRAEVVKQRELDSLKIRFFTNVSHELRTPLTLIIGPVESLLRSKSVLNNEHQNIQLGLIHRNAQRLLRLVNQLLDFSKIEAGKTLLETQQSDIISFLKYIAEPFSMLAAEKNIQFETQFHFQSQLLWFDADKIEKVLSNLLSNAFKNTPENGYITLKTNENNGFLEIEIIDSGTGIAKNELDRIFERFYQAEKQTQAKQRGSGIGLSLTKEFVEMHHGQITVESKIGEGSVFKISLPLGDAYLSDAQKLGAPLFLENLPNGNEASPLIPILSSSSEKEDLPLLLVIDDNEDIRTFVRSNLQDIYNIIEAPDGMQGMEMAVEYMPDIIVSDVMMPVADGIDLCRQVKADRRTSHIPVVLLTAKTSDESKIEGFETGADDYLVKPFGIDVLKARLKNLLETRRRLRELYKSDITIDSEAFTDSSVDNELVKRIYEIVELNISDPDFNPDILARELLMSRSSLYMKIKAISGETVSIFVRNIRLKKAAELLKLRKYSVSEISFQVGFSQTQYFSKCFKETFGVTPSEYR